VVEGFTSIKSAKVRLRDLNVLVGANGAGKSNFIAAPGMLGRIVDDELSLFVGRAGGASAVLNESVRSAERIRLEVELEAGGYSGTMVPAAGDSLIFLDEAIWKKGGVVGLG